MKHPKMDKELRTTSFAIVALFFLVFSATFQGCFSASNQPQTKKKQTQSTSTHGFGSSAVFPVLGNVYPDGIYTVSLKIGTRTEPYVLDIDTGSDLTWLQCDAPCVSCTKAPEFLYKPINNNLVRCNDPVCAAFYWPGKLPCKTPNEQCDYEVMYADHGSSLGVLVKDSFPLRFINGSSFSPRLAFGCGYNQQFSHSNPPPSTDGVLGLGIGKSSIVSQLRDLGITRNVLGHCLSGRGGGFMFFGDDLVPPSGIVWAPMKSLEKHYSSGPAELLFGGQSTGVKGLLVVFDSGSSYTYFSSQAYRTTLSLVRKGLKGAPLKDTFEDRSLSVCWKGAKPFRSVRDVKNYFKPLVLRFTKAKNVQLELTPEAYLIVTERGNVCLGILNGTEVGLENLNLIGDISMQDKMVIYDNEKQQIGWATANCDRLPKS